MEGEGYMMRESGKGSGTNQSSSIIFFQNRGSLRPNLFNPAVERFVERSFTRINCWVLSHISSLLINVLTDLTLLATVINLPT